MADIQTLLAWAAAERQKRVVSGLDFNGMRLETDTDSQRVLTSAYVMAKGDPTFQIDNWKVADGIYVPLSNETVISAGDAVTAHVQACFNRNKEIDDAILSGAITTLEQIVAAFEDLN
jgi:hypothetical protein